MMAKQWVKWPVLALWCCASQRDSLASLACFTQWQLTSNCCNSCTWLTQAAGQKIRDTLNKDRQANGQSVPLCASFCMRILRRCTAEEEISYVYRSAPPNSWHLPNTPSTEKSKEENCDFIAESEKHTLERNVSWHWLWSDKVKWCLPA